MKELPIVKVYCLYSLCKTRNDKSLSWPFIKKLFGVSEVSDFDFGEHGKPYLKQCSNPNDTYNYFSLSDEDGLTVIAVSEIEVGADLHEIGIDDESVIRRYFTKAEYDKYLATSAEERPMLFGYMWSKIEASLKCIGTGLDLDFRRHRELIDGLYVKTEVLDGRYVLSCACRRNFCMQLIRLPDDYLEREDS